MSNKVKRLLSIPVELDKELVKIADKTYRSVNNLIIFHLTKLIKSESKKERFNDYSGNLVKEFIDRFTVPGKMIKRTSLYKIMKNSKTIDIGQHEFYQRVRELGYKDKKTNGCDYFIGIEERK